MTIEIITAHEADQIARMKQPLSWPIYSTFPHCSGPCQQGRSLCLTPEACQSGQHTDDDEISKFGAFNAAPAVAIGLVFMAVLAALVLAASGVWK